MAIMNCCRNLHLNPPECCGTVATCPCVHQGKCRCRLEFSRVHLPTVVDIHHIHHIHQPFIYHCDYHPTLAKAAKEPIQKWIERILDINMDRAHMLLIVTVSDVLWLMSEVVFMLSSLASMMVSMDLARYPPQNWGNQEFQAHAIDGNLN